MDKCKALIGGCYFMGEGVERDLAQAKHYLKLCADEGSPEAVEMLEAGPRTSPPFGST